MDLGLKDRVAIVNDGGDVALRSVLVRATR